MTDSSAGGLDPGVATRLREMSRAEAASTSPWPGLDHAVRRGRRRHRVARGVAAVLCVVAAWFVVPVALESLDSSGPVAGPGSPPTDSAANPAPMSVADYFDPPQPFPGPTWTRYGEPAGGEINTIAGPDHCDWQSAVMMHLGWPLGTVSRTSAESRQFIRDPEGVMSVDLQRELRAEDLPVGAEDTGYRLDGLQLWLSAADPQGAYLVSAVDVERWPRADPMIGCA